MTFDLVRPWLLDSPHNPWMAYDLRPAAESEPPVATIRHQCPHCHTNDMALVALAWTFISDFHGVAHLECPRCRLPSAAEIRATPSGVIPQVGRFEQGFGGDPTAIGYSIFDFWPAIPGPNVPEYLPPKVHRVYLQAERNFPTDGNEEAAGMLYRKALDVGLLQIDPTLIGMLGQKIKALAKAGKLTADLEDWSGHVRDLGNEAAHDDEPPTRQDLNDLRGFTEMVLRYLFTLPGMVKQRRAQDAEAPAP